MKGKNDAQSCKNYIGIKLFCHNEAMRERVIDQRGYTKRIKKLHTVFIDLEKAYGMIYEGP